MLIAIDINKWSPKQGLVDCTLPDTVGSVTYIDSFVSQEVLNFLL